MEDEKKIQEKIFDDLYEDIINISRVLPNLTPLDLQTELIALKDDPDRVTTILRKHFSFYNEDRENPMSQDIKMIKRVLPNCPIVQISKDLTDVVHKKNRVQLVLKKYFNQDSNPFKRSLDNIESSPSKILKLEQLLSTKTNSVSSIDPIVLPEDSSDSIDLTNHHSFVSTSPTNLKTEETNVVSNNSININELESLPIKTTSKLTLDDNITTDANQNMCISKDAEQKVEDVSISSTIDVANIKDEFSNQDSTGVNNEQVDSILLNTDVKNSATIEANKIDNSYCNNDERKTLFEIINNLYPDLNLEQMELILLHLDINIRDCADDTTLNVVLNEIINYFETKDKSEQVETTNECFVPFGPQSNESTSTEEYEPKDEVNKFIQMSVENKHTISVPVKQESPLQFDKEYLSTTLTDQDLGLISQIYREIEESSKNVLTTQVIVGSVKNEPSETVLNKSNCDEAVNNDGMLNSSTSKSFTSIASGTDNWVKSALVQSKDNFLNPTTNITSNSGFDNIITNNIIKPAKAFVKIERENFGKKAACSTVTSASPDKWLRNAGSFQNRLDVPQVQQYKRETPLNVVNYTEYGLDLTRRRSIDDYPLESVLNQQKPPNIVNFTRAENWTAINHAAANPVRTIERPPRDNLRSSFKNCFDIATSTGTDTVVASNTAITPAAAAAAASASSNKNFVQYLENRNIQNPNSTVSLVQNNNNNNNNNLVESIGKMSKRHSFLTKREENEMATLLCELEGGKCNLCKKCLRKNTKIALKVRNDLFPRGNEPQDSLSDDESMLVERKRNKPATIPIVDLSECSNPVPGTSSGLQSAENHHFYYKIMEMFPDVCPDYLRNLCTGKDQTNDTLDYLISFLLEGNYNRRERPTSPAQHLEFDEQYKTLLDLFPDADPTYLQHHCERLMEHPNDFKEFVASLLEHKNYPSKEEYLKKMKLSAQQKQYTTEFDVKKFLEVIPNPDQYFKNRIVKRNFTDQDYALTFLKNHYSHLTIRDITTIFRDSDYSIVKASVMLDKLKKNMKSKRRMYPLTSCLNIPLLQEIAYVKNKAEILNYMKTQEQEKIQARQIAKNAGVLKTCECCYDDEVMPEDMACCESGHIFCKECVKKGCEVKMGEGKSDFPCLTNCEARFSLQVLQTVLTPKVFSKMVQKKQLEEVKSAGIEDLEFCPFCDFATIPAPGDKLFRCLNNDCMKESCRECKEPSHIPLRCDEVEKENDVKLRTYIEDKMTEALIRKCYKCGMKFIKEEGCNKMTCSCGAMMCYVCNQPVTDYKHFNGQGGDQFHLCPLYSDTHKLHMDAVKLSAENAKKELGIANNQLKIDPTANLDQHYKMLANRNPQNLPPGMEHLNPQHIHIRIQEFHLERR